MTFCSFRLWPSRSPPKKISPQSFYASSFLKVHVQFVHVHHSLKIKSRKEVTKQQKSRFFLIFFCLLMTGSVSGAGSVQINYGSGCGSRRPKNQSCGSGFVSESRLDTESMEFLVSGFAIRIRIGGGRKKRPTKLEKNNKFHFLMCWMFSFEG